ncbi:hypothetical protein GDO81_006902 [Engystomops pustulosus]|uniref:Uncharacterized protein n=1 Tax=Engystomops pustulosus TaxID=76066 RepID=A0AAV7D1H8_ENGPU|nr:hypothetical protein GDO81_006902 [Engystomops pustulosus]
MEEYISLASISIILRQVGYSTIKAQADITKTPFDTMAPNVTLSTCSGVQEIVNPSIPVPYGLLWSYNVNIYVLIVNIPNGLLPKNCAEPIHI